MSWDRHDCKHECDCFDCRKRRRCKPKFKKVCCCKCFFVRCDRKHW